MRGCWEGRGLVERYQGLSRTSSLVVELIRMAMVSEEGETMRANARRVKALFSDRDLNGRCIDNLTCYLEEKKKSE